MKNQIIYPDIFSIESTNHLYSRIDKLTPESKPIWGKMNVAQMMAHCCKPYEQALEGSIKPPPALMKILVRLFFKKSMVNDIPYAQNLPTNPNFIIANKREFDIEKIRLKSLIEQFEKKGASYFDGKKQATLGKLSTAEWNNMMYKHIDHHLRQFGV